MTIYTVAALYRRGLGKLLEDNRLSAIAYLKGLESPPEGRKP